jgi:mono/diheme cytochrome c family protein
MRYLLFSLFVLAVFAGCYQGQPSQDPPVHPVRNMYDQQRYNTQAPSEFFPDGATMRVPPAGTVARGFLREDSLYFTGMERDTFPVQKSPVLTTMAVLKRGQERYNIYCAPCHSRMGDGKGIVVNRGMVPPPSFHEDRVRQFADGHIYSVISNGIRNMPPYRYQIPVEDRWAIVAYVRALQRSQNATANDIPSDVKGTIK